MATGIKVNADSFSCPICLEVIRSPKSLPCLHSFCEQCINEFICAANRKQECKIATYQCPVCRTVVTPTNPEVDASKWASLLPSNFTLTTLMESTSGKEKQECHSCKRRGQFSVGIMWCRNCIEALCQTCSEYHSSIKSSVDHRVIKIDELDVKGIDVNAISQACPIHISKVIEAFCFDHKKLCCVLCLTLHHRKCNDVKAIDEISDETKIESPTLNEVIEKLQSTVEIYIARKQQQIEHFKESLKNSEATATKHVECAKDKLVRLLLSFTKQLSLLGDNEIAKLDDELGILKQLSKNACHLRTVSKMVNEQGTIVQKFIHTENTKEQILNNILPAICSMYVDEKIEINLVVGSAVEAIERLAEIGNLMTVKIPSVQQENENLDFVRNYIGINTTHFKVSYKKIITLPNVDFTCGAWVSENMVICAAAGDAYIRAVDTNSGSVKFKFNWTRAKRMVVNRQRRHIYVTYKRGHFAAFSFQTTSGFDKIYDSCSSSIDICGLTIFENDLYMIVNDTIRKTMIDNMKKAATMDVCLAVNTECSDSSLNSLVINPFTRNLIYTSKDNEVICTNLEGKHVFCIKHESIENPTSLAIHSSGTILVGSETGSVHAISSNGKQCWTLIDKCKSIKKLCDVWMDESERILFLCGNNYLEMYDIVN